MMDYLITCSIISICALLACIFLKNAPARISFYLLMLALLSWFIPWQLIPDTLSAKVQVDAWFDLTPISLQSSVIHAQANSSAQQLQASHIYWYQLFTWGHLFIAAFILGGTLFLFRLNNYLTTVKYLNEKAIYCQRLSLSSQAYPVKVTQLNTPAIATGLFKPTIWVDPQLLQRPELGSVLLHEATHIRQGDIVWIWLICLTESLFWWNPICRMLAKQARQLLELSCDESCFKLLQQKYQFDLASLLLNPLTASSKQSFAGTPILNIVDNNSFNIFRVKMLNKEKVVKIKHLVILMAAVSISAVAAVQISERKPEIVGTKLASTVTFSEVFEAQQALLLQAAAKAKSTNHADLKQVVANINSWQNNRTALTDREEKIMRLNAFTLLTHVLHRLGQHQEVINTFEKWYPKGQGSNVPFYLRNITANAYLQMHKPDLALEELAIVQSAIGDKIRPGTLNLLALAYAEKDDYTNASKALSHPNVDDNLPTNLLKYYIYNQQHDVIRIEQVKAKLPKYIASKPATLPDAGIPSSPLMELLTAV